MSVFRIFKKFKAHIAQLLLGVIILPALSFIISIIAPEQATNFISGLISEISIFHIWEIWIQSIVTLRTSMSTDISMNILSILSEIVNIVNATILESATIGLVCCIVKELCDLIRIKGIPVLQTILGLFIGCLIVKMVDSSNIVYVILVLCFLLILHFLLTTLISGTQDYFTKMVKPGFSIITIGVASGYASVNHMIMKGVISDFVTAVSLLATTFTILLIFLVVDYVFLTKH